MLKLGGNQATVDLMNRYAELLWFSVPQDWGMRTGSDPSPSPRYQPNQAVVLAIMTEWAQAGYSSEPLPLCMEDETCSACTRLLASTVRSYE